MAYDDYFGSVKRPTISKPPFGEEKTSGVNRVQAVKNLRAEFPGMGLKEAVDIVDGNAPRPDDPAREVQLVLTPVEQRAAERALARSNASPASTQVRAFVEAVNEVRANDAVGTVRRNPVISGAWAFAVEPGKYLIIETGGDKPRFRSSLTDETASIKRGWPLVVGG